MPCVVFSLVKTWIAAGATESCTWQEACIWVSRTTLAAGVQHLLCVGSVTPNSACTCHLCHLADIWLCPICRNMVMTFLQAYRVIVLPVANTWMSWSLLHKMSITPSGPVILLLGVVLLACIIMGLQVSERIAPIRSAWHCTYSYACVVACNLNECLNE